MHEGIRDKLPPTIHEQAPATHIVIADKAGQDTAWAEPPQQAPRSSAPSSASRELSSTQAEYLDNPPPAYPLLSQRRGEQGGVIVSALVTVEGLVKEASVEVSSGYMRLDDAAVVAVRAWKFVPAKRAGVTVEMRYRIPVRFELDSIAR